MFINEIRINKSCSWSPDTKKCFLFEYDCTKPQCWSLEIYKRSLESTAQIISNKIRSHLSFHLSKIIVEIFVEWSAGDGIGADVSGGRGIGSSGHATNASGQSVFPIGQHAKSLIRVTASAVVSSQQTIDAIATNRRIENLNISVSLKSDSPFFNNRNNCEIVESQTVFIVVKWPIASIKLTRGARTNYFYGNRVFARNHDKYL